MITTGQKQKMMDCVANFSCVARTNGWFFDYDADIDAMAIRQPVLSPDTRKYSLNDDIMFYINGRDEIEGIFIEYFMFNFIAHHQSGEKIDYKNTGKMLPEFGKILMDSVR